MNIKQSIFLHKLARQTPRQVSFPHFNKVKSILLLYQSEWTERNPEIRAIVAQLHDEQKQVTLYGYIKKDQPLSPFLADSCMLGTKHFNLLDRPKADVHKLLALNHYDMLIDLTTSPLLPMQYIALMAKADFKIGAHTSSLYDMVIQSPSQVSADYIFQQVMHYVKLIKSAD